MSKEFAYRCLDRDGNPATGRVPAGDLGEAKELLWAKKYTILDLKPAGKGFSYEIKLPGSDRVKPATLSMFARLMVSLMEDSRTVTQALKTIGRQMERSDPKFAKVIDQVYNDTQGNATPFHVAIGKHPKVFPELMVHLCAAGDRGSFFLEALRESAKAFDSSTRLRRYIVSALIYPAIIAVVMVFVVTGLLIFVVPKMQTLYTDLGGELPFLTNLVIGVSGFIGQFWWLIGATLFGLSWWWKKVRNRPAVRYFTDNLMLRLPKIGVFIQDIAMARFCRNFALLARSGIPIQSVIDMTINIVNNRVVAEPLERMKEAVDKGAPLARPLEESWVFSPYVIAQVSVGSESSSLPELLLKAADYYDEEVEEKAKRLPTIINTAVVMVALALTAVILFAMYLPMFGIYSLVE